MNSKTQQPQWVCCQLGARENYAIPRALKTTGTLHTLITDAWIPSGNLLGKFRRSLKERFHPDLVGSLVSAANLAAIQFELTSTITRRRDWDLILSRNVWFQKQIIRELESLERSLQTSSAQSGHLPKKVLEGHRANGEESIQETNPDRPVLFSYSYTALEPFRWAKERGWTTVLGQIDPGIGEENLLYSQLESSESNLGQFQRAPVNYWNQWQEECLLADTIIANSEWSKKLLIDEGIPAEKLRVIPLAYTPPAETAKFTREYPDRFTSERPLRVLFLGQFNLRKGGRELIEAIRRFSNEPVEFWIVGPVLIDVGQEMQEHPSIRWIGPVARSEVSDWYRRADVFLFPTHCDGFGLTQLEAQAWKLPVIASPFCGDVVRSNVNGWLLTEVTAERIIEAIRLCLIEPRRLAEWAANAIPMADFRIERLGQELTELDRRV